tara:strand:- start:629 stop:1237 length:609 start_codon:yes stop_codon:yes gene_type:complete
MIEIFAHRAIFNGIENSAKSIPYYKKLGIGIELDLRYNNNQVYISHDPTNNGDFFEEVCKQYDKSSIKLALHIKENEALNPTIKILEKYSIKNYFLFNTENFEYSNLVDKTKIADYVVKQDQNIKAKILWCDELQNKWYSEKIVKNLHERKKLIYVMSLEVLEKCDEKSVYLEWERLINLGVDGICTKYPEKLIKFVKGDLN